MNKGIDVQRLPTHYDYHHVLRVNGNRVVFCTYVTMTDFNPVLMGRARTRCPRCGATVTP